MRVKHNKKRNTAFLYESLITELTKAIVRGQDEKKQKVSEILPPYSTPKSTLEPLKIVLPPARELNFYKIAILDNHSKNNRKNLPKSLPNPPKTLPKPTPKLIFSKFFSNPFSAFILDRFFVVFFLLSNPSKPEKYQFSLEKINIFTKSTF